MKNAIFLRLLSLMLALVMVLGCFVGCGSSSNTGSGSSGKSDEDEDLEALRDSLERHKYDGLNVYLSEDFEEGSSRSWTNGDLTVSAMTAPLSDLDAEVETAKEFRDYMVELYEVESDADIQTGQENGVYYIVLQDGDEAIVMGLYIKGNTVGLINVLSEDFDKFEDDMIMYATLGELKDYYKDATEDVTVPTFEPGYDGPSEPEDSYPTEATEPADPVCPG